MNDNLVSIKDRKGQKTEYTYDYLDRITKATYEDGSSTEYFYDAVSRLTTVTDTDTGMIEYSYSNTGCSVCGGNAVDRITKEITSLGTIEYEYDAIGRRTSMTVAGQEPVTYSYDSNSRLTSVVGAGLAPAQITYDNNGNMTSVTNSCGTTNYTWNARNRLIAINGFNSDCSSLTASFKYDALGRRIEKSVTDTVNGTRITAYLYDGMDIVQEIEGGTVTANYIRTLNIDEPLARIKSDGTVRYYQADALGSVIALTDENGNVKAQYKYSPFGDVETIGEASDNPFQFAGRENDGTGLLYERFRYYSPELHRYISPDPLQFGGGNINWYVRVNNSPINLIDPLGLIECQFGPKIPKNPWIPTDFNKFNFWPDIPGKLDIKPKVDPNIDLKNLIKNPGNELNKLKDTKNWNLGISITITIQW